MGTTDKPLPRCRLCFCRFSEDPIQITDTKGKLLEECEAVSKIKSILHMNLSFPKNLKCILLFPHVVCIRCYNLLNEYMLFLQRAHTIDNLLRDQNDSNTTSLDDIEDSLGNKYSPLSNVGNVEQKLLSPDSKGGHTEIITDSDVVKKHTSFSQCKESTSHRLQKSKSSNSPLRRPISILPKTSQEQCSSSSKRLQKYSYSNGHPAIGSFEEGLFEEKKPLDWNQRQCRSCGVPLHVTTFQNAYQNTNQTKIKAFECSVETCKRNFRTITSLKHHSKHFHKLFHKTDSTAYEAENPEGIVHSIGLSKFYDPISNQRKPELSKDTFVSPTTVEYISNVSAKLTSPSERKSEQIQLSRVESKSQHNEKKFSRNLSKQFDCSFRGCLKTYTKKHFLIDHERVHKGEKPYRCKHCDRTFYRVTDLKKHTLLSVCQ